MRLGVGEERDGDGGLDVVLKQAFLGETNSWFLRKKPRQRRRQWGPGVAGPGDSDYQTVDVVGRDGVGGRWEGSRESWHQGAVPATGARKEACMQLIMEPGETESCVQRHFKPGSESGS